MEVGIYLYSTQKGEIKRFLDAFYRQSLSIANDLKWNKNFENPTEMNDMIGTFIENNDQYTLSMWVSLDKGIYVQVTEHNADSIIRYIFERFPY